MKKLEDAVNYSTYNKNQFKNNCLCGCYHCLEIFQSKEIRNWIDNQETALCPYCGIDSILTIDSGYDINEESLKELHNHWYSSI